MSRLSRTLTFVSGALLLMASQWLTGFLEAVPTPQGFRQQFGAHRTLALVCDQAIFVALPVFLIAIAWGYLTLRPLRSVAWKGLGWCLAGVVLMMIGQDVRLLMEFLDEPAPAGGGGMSAGSLLGILVFPWQMPWAILTTYAAPLGLVAAAALLRGRADGASGDAAEGSAVTA